MEQELAVVILNYNGHKHLQTFLPDVIKYSHPFRIVVVDNNSTDKSVEFIELNFKEVQLIKLPQNLGYAGGYAKALKEITTDYFILLNNDVQVTPNWINPLLEYMQKNKGISACQPKILDYYKNDCFEYAGACGGFIDAFGYPFCRGRIFESLEKDENQYNDTAEIFWASGACMLVNKLAYTQAGGFDESYFAHMEEIDLCWRMKNIGYKIACVPQSKVYHVGGGTLPKPNPQKTYLNFRNSLITLTKNHPSAGVFYKIIFRLFLDGIAGFKFLLELKPMHTMAVIKAHFSYYYHLSGTLEKRKKQKRLNNHSFTLNRAYNGLIVKEYFVKGIKKFNSLKSGFIN